MIRLFILLTALVVFSQPADAQGRKKRKKINNVITEARSYLGTPYNYGGNSHKGIDCSGLIYNSYKKIGVTLPRTSKQQSKIGSSKSWSSVRPGDLVYFKFKEKHSKWYHSGLIISVKKGEIKFIHASTSRGVVISNLNDDYYRKNVKKFRRVI